MEFQFTKLDLRGKLEGHQRWCWYVVVLQFFQLPWIEQHHRRL